MAWNTVDEKWNSYRTNRCNLRFCPVIGGFNPFSMLSSKYNCRLVMLVTYNLSSILRMKKENIMLTLLIFSPNLHGNDIDVYLVPLLEDLHYI